MLRLLDRAEECLIATLMAGATLLIFVSVIHRFASEYPILHALTARIDLSWAQELCIFMFIWMAKFGAAYGVRTGIHVGVDVLVRKLDDTWRTTLVVFALCAGVLFTAVVGTMGAKFVLELMRTDQVTPDLELPSWIAYACIPLGSYLMSFRFLQVCYRFLQTGRLPIHDQNAPGASVHPQVTAEAVR